MFINKSMSIMTNNYLGMDYDASHPSQLVFVLFTGTPPTAEQFMQAVEAQRFNQSGGDFGNVAVNDLLDYIQTDLGHQLLGTMYFPRSDNDLWNLVNEDLTVFDTAYAAEEKFNVVLEGTAGFLLTMSVDGTSNVTDLPNNSSQVYHLNMSRVNTPANGGEVQISDTNITFDKVIKLSSIQFRLN